MDIYLSIDGKDNMHYGEFSTYPNIKEPILSE